MIFALFFVRALRHRIVASLAKRMAAKETKKRQYPAAQRPKALDGLQGIVRATRKKAASRQPRRRAKPLIKLYRPNQKQRQHRSRLGLSQQVRVAQEFLHRHRDLGAFYLRRFLPCHKHQIKARSYARKQLPKRLANDSTCAISLHRVADFFTRSYAKPHPMHAILQDIHDHARRHVRLALIIQPAKVAMSLQSNDFFHTYM